MESSLHNFCTSSITPDPKFMPILIEDLKIAFLVDGDRILEGILKQEGSYDRPQPSRFLYVGVFK